MKTAEDKGEKIGAEKEKTATIVRMKSMNFTIEQIAAIVDLPVDKVEEILNQYNSQIIHIR